MNVLIYRNKHQTKTGPDYSSMIGKVFEVFTETKSNFIVFSNTNYKFVTVVPKRDCNIVNTPTVNYSWK